MIPYEEKNKHLSNDYLPIHAFSTLTTEDVPPHWHYYIELLYLVSGSCQIFLDNQLLHLNSNEFLWIPSNTIHYILASCDSEFLVVQFSPKLLQDSSASLVEGKYFMPLLQTRVIHISGLLNTQKLLSIFKHIIEDYNCSYIGYEIHLKALLYHIFTYLFKNSYIAPATSSIEEEILQKINTVTHYIGLHYGESLTVSDGCKIASMSYHHFCRTFKKVTHKTFMEYVHFIRLREAEKLLLTTSLSITEIALQVGFTNSAYFSSVFKKEGGLSPLSYRSKHKIINSNHNINSD